MGGNTGKNQIGSERELYQYINHQAGTTKKASTRIIFIQMNNIFRLLIGVPDYSSESYREKQKLIGFIVIGLMWKTYTPGPRGRYTLL